MGGTGGGPSGGSAGGSGGGAAGGSAGGAADAGISPGGPCSFAGFLCHTSAVALECRLGVWVALPCRGDGGCTIDAGLVRCDMRGNLAGDACASTAEFKGQCAPDARGTLECRSGVLVLTNVCRSCIEQNDTVICQP